MNMPDYSLPLTDAKALLHARRWLLLGVISLGVAGIFAGILSNTKSPYFYKALVVHVDLSVLVWFLTMACMFFAISTAGRGYAIIKSAAFYCFAIGACCIVLSGFTQGEAYMSNYIPVIHHPIFFLGLSLLLCGVVGMAFNQFVDFKPSEDLREFGIITAAIIMLLSMGCFVASQRAVPVTMHGQIYYEYAFWGGGHMLQFVHTQLMLVAWMWLASAAEIKIKPGKKLLYGLYGIGLLSALAGIGIYDAYNVASDEHRNAFTMLMKHMNGFAPIIAGVMLITGILIYPWNKAQRLPRIMLLMSIILFASGGVLGYMIAGSNVTVPAHYHGSIVGITLAFMGVAYLLLPAFGWADVSKSVVAFIQPIIYGGGQLCWMTGMAILGNHGVPRKTPGSADTVGAVASFLKHSGDGLALIGGLLFVFVVLRAVFSRQPAVYSWQEH